MRQPGGVASASLIMGFSGKKLPSVQIPIDGEVRLSESVALKKLARFRHNQNCWGRMRHIDRGRGAI